EVHLHPIARWLGLRDFVGGPDVGGLFNLHFDHPRQTTLFDAFGANRDGCLLRCRGLDRLAQPALFSWPVAIPGATPDPLEGPAGCMCGDSEDTASLGVREVLAQVPHTSALAELTYEVIGADRRHHLDAAAGAGDRHVETPLAASLRERPEVEPELTVRARTV